MKNNTLKFSIIAEAGRPVYLERSNNFNQLVHLLLGAMKTDELIEALVKTCASNFDELRDSIIIHEISEQ
jgi:hypothetical protein